MNISRFFAQLIFLFVENAITKAFKTSVPYRVPYREVGRQGHLSICIKVRTGNTTHNAIEITSQIFKNARWK